MPIFSSEATIERFDSDVSINTGVVSPRSRSLASIPGPSRTGMVTSSTTRSTVSASRRPRPCSPSSASATSGPSCLICLATIVRTARLSSTVNILGMVILPRSGLVLGHEDQQPQVVLAAQHDPLLQGTLATAEPLRAGGDLGQPQRLVQGQGA